MRTRKGQQQPSLEGLPSQNHSDHYADRNGGSVRILSPTISPTPAQPRRRRSMMAIEQTQYNPTASSALQQYEIHHQSRRRYGNILGEDGLMIATNNRGSSGGNRMGTVMYATRDRISRRNNDSEVEENGFSVIRSRSTGRNRNIVRSVADIGIEESIHHEYDVPREVRSKGFMYIRPVGWVIMIISFAILTLAFGLIHIVFMFNVKFSQQTFTCDINIQPPTHLIILSHGWTGTPGNMDVIAEQIYEKYTHKKNNSPPPYISPHLASLSDTVAENECILIHKVHGNFGWFRSLISTSDGIDMGSQRIVQEILAVKSAYPTLDKVSFLGHSLGGLYMRYTAALLALFDENANLLPLEQRNAFIQGLDIQSFMNQKDHMEQVLVSAGAERKNIKLAGMEPINFMTFSTPHAGVQGALWTLSDLVANVCFGAWRPTIEAMQFYRAKVRQEAEIGHPPSLFTQIRLTYYNIWESFNFGRTFFQIILDDDVLIDYSKELPILSPFMKQHIFGLIPSWKTLFWKRQPAPHVARRIIEMPQLTELLAESDRSKVMNYKTQISQILKVKGQHNPNFLKQELKRIRPSSLLNMMADPESLFMKIYAAFQDRAVYASLTGDFFVPCCSALVSHVCPDPIKVDNYPGISSVTPSPITPAEMETFQGKFFFHHVGGNHESAAHTHSPGTQPAALFIRQENHTPLLSPVEGYGESMYSGFGESLTNLFRGRSLLGEQYYPPQTKEAEIIKKMSILNYSRGGALWGTATSSFFSHGFTVYGFKAWSYILSGSFPICPAHAARVFFPRNIYKTFLTSDVAQTQIPTTHIESPPFRIQDEPSFGQVDNEPLVSQQQWEYRPVPPDDHHIELPSISETTMAVIRCDGGTVENGSRSCDADSLSDVSSQRQKEPVKLSASSSNSKFVTNPKRDIDANSSPKSSDIKVRKSIGIPSAGLNVN